MHNITALKLKRVVRDDNPAGTVQRCRKDAGRHYADVGRSYTVRAMTGVFRLLRRIDALGMGHRCEQTVEQKSAECPVADKDVGDARTVMTRRFQLNIVILAGVC